MIIKVLTSRRENAGLKWIEEVIRGTSHMFHSNTIIFDGVTCEDCQRTGLISINDLFNHGECYKEYEMFETYENIYGTKPFSSPGGYYATCRNDHIIRIVNIEIKTKSVYNIFISQPMSLVSEREYWSRRYYLEKLVDEYFHYHHDLLDEGDEIKFIETYNQPPSPANITDSDSLGVWYLGNSIKKLATADFVVFDEHLSRGCRIESEIAREYKKKMIFYGELIHAHKNMKTYLVSERGITLFGDFSKISSYPMITCEKWDKIYQWYIIDKYEDGFLCYGCNEDDIPESMIPKDVSPCGMIDQIDHSWRIDHLIEFANQFGLKIGKTAFSALCQHYAGYGGLYNDVIEHDSDTNPEFDYVLCSKYSADAIMSVIVEDFDTTDVEKIFGSTLMIDTGFVDIIEPFDETKAFVKRG